MEVIYSGRKTSRTTRLIQLCAEAEDRGEPSYIVCESRRQVELIAQKARELGLDIHTPITFGQWMGRPIVETRNNRVSNYFIDNADYLLQYLSGPVVVAAIVIEKETQDADEF